jgi:hypothetical protein
MIHLKGTFLSCFSLLLFTAFLLSCHSNHNVVSSYGKRKYTKGWFFFKRKSADTKAAKGRDTTQTHTYPVIHKTEKKESVSTEAPVKEDEHNNKKLSRRAKKDSIRKLLNSKPPDIAAEKNKTKPPPEPPDPVMLRLLILVVFLTAISVFITGLITPIIIWGITQNFLISMGIALTFFAYVLSVDTKPGIDSANTSTDKRYNLGKPAWRLTEWAFIPTVLLVTTIRTSLVSDLLLTQISTIGLFISCACMLLSLILAIKALFVNDRHKNKARLALVIDALLITALILLIHFH